LRLAEISTIEEANRFLLETCLPRMNGKFSPAAFDPADAYVLPRKTDLNEILCFERERVVTNDYVVRFGCRLFQICKSNKPLLCPKDKVTVQIRLDGSCSIFCKDKMLLVKELHIS
jgi:hypothetical protein